MHHRPLNLFRLASSGRHLKIFGIFWQNQASILKQLSKIIGNGTKNMQNEVLEPFWGYPESQAKKASRIPAISLHDGLHFGGQNPQKTITNSITFQIRFQKALLIDFDGCWTNYWIYFDKTCNQVQRKRFYEKPKKPIGKLQFCKVQDMTLSINIHKKIIQKTQRIEGDIFYQFSFILNPILKPKSIKKQYQNLIKKTFKF